MFTLEQIKTAHAKVKSGADFPSYVQELKSFGVNHYDQYVIDGHTNYYGTGDFKISSDAKYPVLNVANIGSTQKLQNDLKIHQQGQTDYLTFCKDTADAGVEKWTVDMTKMTCAYYDKNANEMLAEIIPSLSFNR